jgi:MFS family permease
VCSNAIIVLQKGPVFLKDCTFSCNATTLYTGEPEAASLTKIQDNNESTTEDYNYDESEANPGVNNEAELDFPTTTTTTTAVPVSSRKTNSGIVLSPHMCYKNSEDVTVCEVYTKYSKNVQFNVGLKPTITRAIDNETEDDICTYPVADYFHCRMPEEIVKDLRATEDPNCRPMVLCAIHDPYNVNNTDSLLKKSECGYNNISFWLYLVIRSIADIFPAAAVALLSTAVVIATRETSTGRGDIGKQLAAGALGFAIFAPIIGGCADGNVRDAMICFTVLMLLAILILLFDNNMPLSPPEWWWHTRCGLLALPMSSVRKYQNEIIALGVVLFILGILWNAIDAYLPWNAATMAGSSNLIIGLTLTMGAIPAASLFTFAEKVVDYCNHSNILILCFVSYIIHYVALANITDAGILLVFEILEIFTLHLMWITAILYLRHLVPRKFTACGQALPVIAHFCLGRCFGALIGRFAYTLYPDNVKYPDNHGPVYAGFAIAAAIIAALYFVAYHFYLKPYCGAHPQLPFSYS